jgi:hypothetical protein
MTTRSLPRRHRNLMYLRTQPTILYQRCVDQHPDITQLMLHRRYQIVQLIFKLCKLRPLFGIVVEAPSVLRQDV